MTEHPKPSVNWRSAKLVTLLGAVPGVILAYALLSNFLVFERDMSTWPFLIVAFTGCLLAFVGWRLWVHFSRSTHESHNLISTALATLGAVLWGMGGALLGVAILSMILL